jgi:hypothetical protein
MYYNDVTMSNPFFNEVLISKNELFKKNEQNQNSGVT